MTKTDSQSGPLAGLSVVETSGEIGTRYCGRLFAQLGATVLQVGSRADDATLFSAWLDQGKDAADDLDAALAAIVGAAGKCVVIAGQVPDHVDAIDAVLRKHGGGDAIVRLGLTWFGQAGPYAGWRGNDAVIQALSGVAFAFGEADGAPTLPQGHAPQMLGGLVGFIGAMAALMAGPSGPRRVDVNVLEAALCLGEIGAVAAAAAPEARATRLGVNRYAPTYPSSLYQTSDGYAGITALTPAQWAATLALIGRSDLASEPRFASSLQRLACADEIDALLQPLFAGKPTAWWVEAGERLRIPITPAPRPADLPGLAHWADRGAFARIEGQVIAAPTLPFHFTFDAVRRPRPDGGAAGPLDGVRVADFSMGWAGPLAARYLADLGADVLKIESTAKPDWWRGWEVLEAQDPPLHELARNFLAANRNKRGLDLDLTTTRGKADAEAIVRRSDLVIENQGPGVMDRLGLGQADQRRLCPGVISISMPPFGKTGPLAGLRAYGSTVEQASGLPFVNGEAHWGPAMQHVAYGDPIAGLYGAAVALAALYGRNVLGGAEIDLCQVECLFQLGADAIIADQIKPLVRTGSRRTTMAPVCVVRALGDEAWLAVAVDNDAAWRGCCRALRDPGLSAGWNLAERAARADAIEAALARWAGPLTPAVAAAELQALGVPAAPVLPTHALWLDAQLVANGYWVTQHRRHVGEHLTPHAPILFDGARVPIHRPAPTLGEHTEEVLAALT